MRLLILSDTSSAQHKDESHLAGQETSLQLRQGTSEIEVEWQSIKTLSYTPYPNNA